jgi:hypothetical protein
MLTTNISANFDNKLKLEKHDNRGQRCNGIMRKKTCKSVSLSCPPYYSPDLFAGLTDDAGLGLWYSLDSLLEIILSQQAT